MKKHLPVRKKIRLEGYDYSSNGAYFITICTENRSHLFGEIVCDNADDGVDDDFVGQGLCSCRSSVHQRDTMTNQRDTMTNQRDTITNQCDTITNQHNSMTNQHNAITNQHNANLNCTNYRLIPTPAGEIIENEWYSLQERYPNIIFNNFVVMPNHVHAIIIIYANDIAGVNLFNDSNWIERRQYEQRQKYEQRQSRRQEQSPCPTAKSPTIGDIVCAYKSITTKICNKNDGIIGRKIWQWRFHDRIIRNESEYLKIWNYINDNPARWVNDTFYIK